MTLVRLAFWFGMLESGFVLVSAGVISHRAFLVISGFACAALMLPQLKLWMYGRAGRPKTAPGTEGQS